MSGWMRRGLKWAGLAVVAVGFLYVAWLVFAAGQPVLAACLVAGFSVAVFVYTAKRAYTWRYLFPGVAGMLIFVVLPLAYTVRIGFTNYSSRNLQTFERSTKYLLDGVSYGQKFDATVHALPEGKYQLLLRARVVEPETANVGEGESSMFDGPSEAEPASAPAAAPKAKGSRRAGASKAPVARAPAPPPAPAAPAPRATYATPPFELGKPLELQATRLPDGAPEPSPALGVAALIDKSGDLAQVKVSIPAEKGPTRLVKTGLREWAEAQPIFTKNADGTLLAHVDADPVKAGDVLRANFDDGFYETADGTKVKPGFKVNIGFGNYVRMATDPDFRGPFLAIFLWTVAFATLTVFFTLCVGMTLAVMLNWEALRFRTLYRTMLFLPYAVPGFISILVFRGLFNQNFGEINLILEKLFGLRPNWFADPTLAKMMILIVNTWLGYPYILVLCTGLIKAIPYDIYEASALEGAGPLRNFFQITAPLILKPLTPLLIASFAFNFNNYALISLLTRGRPDFLDTNVPAGTTDILVTYLNRIAFEDSGQQFGLAAAISTVIFALVAVLSLTNLKLTKANAQEQRY